MKYVNIKYHRLDLNSDRILTYSKIILPILIADMVGFEPTSDCLTGKGFTISTTYQF